MVNLMSSKSIKKTLLIPAALFLLAQGAFATPMLEETGVANGAPPAPADYRSVPYDSDMLIYQDLSLRSQTPTLVPEPGTLVIFGFGLLLLVVARSPRLRARRRASHADG